MAQLEEIKQRKMAIEEKVQEVYGDQVAVAHTMEGYDALRLKATSDYTDSILEGNTMLEELIQLLVVQQEQMVSADLLFVPEQVQEQTNANPPAAHPPVKKDKVSQKKQQKEYKSAFDAQMEIEKANYKACAKLEEGKAFNPELVRNGYTTNVVFKKKVTCKEGDKKFELTQIEILERVYANDFSHLEQLEPPLRYMLAADYMKEHRDDFAGTPEEVVANMHSVSAMMHPLFRLGISLGMRRCLQDNNMGKDAAYFQQLDELLNTAIMVKTITTKPTPDSASPEDLQRNAKSQIFIAKTMFLAQLGDFKKKEKTNVSEWDHTVANAFAHCSRVGFILPSEDDKAVRQDESQSLVGAYIGKKKGAESGFFSRGAATHSLRKKSKKAGGDSFKEKKTIGTFTNQYGMNVAVGGLGNDGIPGENGQARQLKNDGSCGHVYMHLQEGDDDSYTGLLIGFESDSYKKTNQLGHTHGFGNGEFASSFGGQRMDEIADKYGGREVDLSHMEASKVKNLLNQFETKIEELRETDQQKYERTVEKLCGKKMNQNEMNQLLRDLGIGNA